MFGLQFNLKKCEKLSTIELPSLPADRAWVPSAGTGQTGSLVSPHLGGKIFIARAVLKGLCQLQEYLAGRVNTLPVIPSRIQNALSIA